MSTAARRPGSSSARREQASRLSTALARRLLGVTLTDPMSGFFMMRRDRFEELAPQLSSQGFKILLDIVATARGSLRIAELPFVFGERQHGESKLDTRVALDFAALILAKLTNDAVSFRFLLFCLVGLTGIAIHMAMLQVAVGVRRCASAGRRRSRPSWRSPGISCSTTCSPTATSGSPAGSSSPA